ncbi:hypothetical protein HYW46_05585 [Candidatus Daviesbacteria bacterium]|nr:hypothetical protein [Candidatus Daviesbacteria bacterium]
MERLEPKKTIQEVREVQEKYEDKLLCFNFVNKIRNWIIGYPEIKTMGVHIRRNNNEVTFTIKMGLAKNPSQRQLSTLEKGLDGIPIDWAIAGDAYAASS